MTSGNGKHIAFYAPMKSPRSPVPSGDREVARNLMDVIAAGGARVDLVSELRIYDKTGDAQRQNDLQEAARQEVRRLLDEMPPVDLWVTYHNYYKAPDLIGPAVAHARSIPYVQIESTRATSRLTGPWAGFAKAAHDAADAADTIFYFTANDLITLERERFGSQALVHLPPFLPQGALPEPSALDGPMLSVGMMRAGDKLSSYRIIAETLTCLMGDWQLEIAGDGPARPEVEAMMAPFGDRVQFLGQLDRDGLTAVYGRASLFFWPGVNEAFGMAYLEAQAHGLPVAAQDRPGMRDVLTPAAYPAPEEGQEALAEQINALLTDPDLRTRRSAEARQMIATTHLAPAASARFWAAVAPLMEAHP
ncbi:glycosyltransferase family 4 protein [Phaeobacter gallaeciensis]|uniref:glycosyltransferase family 4 protein n=1 Tax=Phaeobacter gallaeciensis TaxID=60890 RepID=UPI00237F998A|nr:glycosyltransferase family 4 protein [Phaeobacter gallaeciensis]MDE4304784.1 glycosyltransferase family 4 protein [Phaeobacter gallaeciensis]MDE4308786.1 glycosyltransferase family 4 protein [Phaeobacter gallaeciensis]MDE4313243.1 glycosyltransferase family 4 protein [Phaeobacter gallaeciensis]MDE4317470.1 glycosyltransferase family 4 protein [Phaeobacter gallaeciensis]MDE4322178.1 glycosyltransferase family 4 protein [Phaeobacter gallaeciensis]